MEWRLDNASELALEVFDLHSLVADVVEVADFPDLHGADGIVCWSSGQIC